MKGFIGAYIEQLHMERIRHRKMSAWTTILALLVVSCVVWGLRVKGISLTNDADCGIYELVVETVVSQADSIVISSTRYPMSLVRSKFLKLNSSHIEYVMDCLSANTTRVRNIKKYMLATLFNAPTTMSGYYQAAVNADFPQYARAK